MDLLKEEKKKSAREKRTNYMKKARDDPSYKQREAEEKERN